MKTQCANSQCRSNRTFQLQLASVREAVVSGSQTLSPAIPLDLHLAHMQFGCGKYYHACTGY